VLILGLRGLGLFCASASQAQGYKGMDEWQAGLCRRFRRATPISRDASKDGFPVRRDVRFAAVLTSILMLITSNIVLFVLYHGYSFVSSEFCL